jgi:cysteine desulfurase
MDPALDRQVRRLYEDAKLCIHAALPAAFGSSLPDAVPVATRSRDRDDYILHPPTGEALAEESAARIGALRDRLYEKITSELDSVVLNGSAEHRLPGNLNISFAFVEGEGLMMAIKDVAVSSGSACTSASLEPSYVLRSMGLEEDMAHSSIRFGLGRFNTEDEVDYVAELVIAKVKRLRDMSPLYEMHKAGIDLKSIQWAAH